MTYQSIHCCHKEAHLTKGGSNVYTIFLIFLPGSYESPENSAEAKEKTTYVVKFRVPCPATR